MNVCCRVGRGRSEDKACVAKVFVIRVENPCNACVTLCANLERIDPVGYILFVGSRQTEQLNVRSQQHIVATVEVSVLKTEMDDLESQEEDTPKRILFFKPMS